MNQELKLMRLKALKKDLKRYRNNFIETGGEDMICYYENKIKQIEQVEFLEKKHSTNDLLDITEIVLED